MFDFKKIVAGAVSGFVAAAVVDVHAWSKSAEPFNWTLAIKRWVAGAISGATAALGIGVTGG
jgi:predicted lysophospholipase L1 biosynthesis ABC-type transport system permease subunit